MFGRIGGQSLRCAVRRPWARRRLCNCERKFSAHHPGPSMAASSGVSSLGAIRTELDRISPCFEVPASNIIILDSPASFYETLKDKIRKARRRIYFSTLYIGKTEHDLIETLDQALAENPDLQVSILTDALRGTRESPDPSCASLLSTLVAKHGSDRVEIRMFHTPNLTGLRKKHIPRRINEGWGLQHMKLYGFDDEIILSGANLSSDYFTNRLDRYHVFHSRELTDYYARIHNAVCSLSFQVLPDAHQPSGYLLDWPSANGAPCPLDHPSKFIAHAATVLNPLIHPASGSQQQPPSEPKPSSRSPNPSQTLVYPVAQFTPLLRPDTSTEFPAVTAILRLLCQVPAFAGSHWLFTAGYFNMHPALSSLLIASTAAHPTRGTVLTASPWANGFFGSAGISGMLPAAYTHLSARFLDRVAAASGPSPTHPPAIELKEWRRGTVGQPGGWTYHAKGLWITLPGEDHPSVTVVGSSNYTKRSYSLDLEAGALVVTGDAELKRKLGAETQWLQSDAQVIERDDLRRTERRVGWHVRLAMWIVERVGGAL
ncbi:CDP-diacylglycerol--glycerol-3-phosphate 3-phosphatidyltransferase [Aspergillus candidus]|uniref:CDP-diacylglycerol--glycerol-3-phosphate 3-phosphatidyltransferase n=1 Tax=Aspergillus candidus TaxID=41067 RepID=A0A2I2EZM3_ASPCN|nr:phosphatidylglycerolphosphate synthase [Aspergillus candidus]PLB33817.1 phosphatidylglycerolphosphate synthase [Aspergillus candidus]